MTRREAGLAHWIEPGSIHQAGRHLTGAPCNGWERWHYEAEDGNLHPIDALRNQLR